MISIQQSILPFIEFREVILDFEPEILNLPL